MGFCFNKQVRMLHAVKDSMKHNKRRQFTQAAITHKSSVSRVRHQLSAEDYSFLRSIGLKVRIPRKK